jgi:DNA-directed RNA polymerase specialized sigma24 family protein
MAMAGSASMFVATEEQLQQSNSVPLVEQAVPRAWGESTLALRQARRTHRYGWLTTPKELLRRAHTLDPRAVASLCAIYRHAVRNFLRGRGVSKDQAEDVTQGFFEGVLRRNDFAQVDPSRSFRAWLRSGALNHLYNERDRERTIKRQLDERKASELRAELEAARTTTDERTLDQQRAKKLVARAWARLRTEYTRMGNAALFEHLRKTLLLEATETTDTELCRRLGHSDSYVAVARHRLRNQDFPAAIMAELKATRARAVPPDGSPTTPTRTVQEELRALLDALS